MEFVLLNPHLVKCRDEQDIGGAPVVNQDPLNIEIVDCSGYYQRIVMEEVQTSQIVIDEGDKRESFGHRCREVINLLLCSPLCLFSMPFRDELEYPPDPNPYG